jgi:hypothetical protein
MSRMSDQQKEYQKEWKRKWRERERLAHLPQKLLAKGKCPICEMLLVAEWHIEHEQAHIQKIVLMMQGMNEATYIPEKVHF